MNISSKTILSIIMFITFVGCENQSKQNQKNDLFVIPSMSKSMSFSKKNNLLIDICQVSLVRISDTIPLDITAWIEHKWIRNNRKVMKTDGIQLVFQADNKITDDLRNLEFQDDSWGATARFGETFSYTIDKEMKDTNSDSLSNRINLKIISPKSKGSRLIFLWGNNLNK